MNSHKRTKDRQDQLYFVSLGPGNRLYSEDHFMKALAPLRITRKAFRGLLKSLSVPYLEIGKTRFVDHTSLSLALRYALRIGNPDFLASGCESLKKGRKPPNTATRINLKHFQENLSTTIAELLAAHHLNAHQTSTTQRREEFLNAGREAARRMILAGFQHLPHKEQAEFTRKAIRDAPIPATYTTDKPP